MATRTIGANAFFMVLLAFFLAPKDGIVEAQDRKLEQKIDALIKVFAHPNSRDLNSEESEAAVKELAKIGRPAVGQLIKGVLGKHADVAGYCAWTLEVIGATAVDPIREKWPTWHELEKWKFMRFRSQFDYQNSLDFVLASLESKNPKVRRLAIEYAGEHKVAQARRALIKMLNTEVPKRHRWLVIESLGYLGNDDEPADALIALLAPNSWAAKGQGLTPPAGYPPPWWPDGRDHVIEALGKMGARKAAPKLLEVLQEKGPKKAYLDFAIVPLLGDWGYTPSIPVLKRILVSDPECLREHIARALLQLKDRSGVPVLMQALKSMHPGERVFACEAFAQHGDKADVYTLGQCLSDPDEGVQSLACKGLERITGLILREPGQKEHTLADVPHWRAWFEIHKGKYKTGK